MPTRGFSSHQMEDDGLGEHYAQHNHTLFWIDPNGVLWITTYDRPSESPLTI